MFRFRVYFDIFVLTRSYNVNINQQLLNAVLSQLTDIVLFPADSISTTRHCLRRLVMENEIIKLHLLLKWQCTLKLLVEFAPNKVLLNQGKVLRLKVLLKHDFAMIEVYCWLTLQIYQFNGPICYFRAANFIQFWFIDMEKLTCYTVYKLELTSNLSMLLH